MEGGHNHIAHHTRKMTRKRAYLSFALIVLLAGLLFISAPRTFHGPEELPKTVHKKFWVWWCISMSCFSPN